MGYFRAVGTGGGGGEKAIDISYADWMKLPEETRNTGTYYINDANPVPVDVFNKLTNLITGTLATGETSITISNAEIKSTSIIEPFYLVDDAIASDPICYETISVTNGSVTMTFGALDHDLVIGLRVL